jgi:hypothetical protein
VSDDNGRPARGYRLTISILLPSEPTLVDAAAAVRAAHAALPGALGQGEFSGQGVYVPVSDEVPA